MVNAECLECSTSRKIEIAECMMACGFGPENRRLFLLEARLATQRRCLREKRERFPMIFHRLVDLTHQSEIARLLGAHFRAACNLRCTIEKRECALRLAE